MGRSAAGVPVLAGQGVVFIAAPRRASRAGGGHGPERRGRLLLAPRAQLPRGAGVALPASGIRVAPSEASWLRLATRHAPVSVERKHHAF